MMQQCFDTRFLANVISYSAKIIRGEMYPSMTRMFLEQNDSVNASTFFCSTNNDDHHSDLPALRICDIRVISDELGDREERVTYACITLALWLHRQYTSQPDTNWHEALLDIIAEHVPALRPKEFTAPGDKGVSIDPSFAMMLAQSFITIARAAASHVRDTYMVNVYTLNKSIIVAYGRLVSWLKDGGYGTGKSSSTLRGMCQLMDPGLQRILQVEMDVQTINSIFTTVAYNAMCRQVQNPDKQRQLWTSKTSLADYVLHGTAAHLYSLATSAITAPRDEGMRSIWTECADGISVYDADRFYVAMQRLNDGMVKFVNDVVNKYTYEAFVEISIAYVDLREYAVDTIEKVMSRKAEE